MILLSGGAEPPPHIRRRSRSSRSLFALNMFKNTRSLIVFNVVWCFLLFSLIQPAIPISNAQQQPQRERRVAPPVTVKTTASPSPTPSASPSPLATPGQGSVPLVSPSPTPTPTPDVAQARAAATTRTRGELQARIYQVLRKPELAPAMIGIKVTSLGDGKSSVRRERRQASASGVEYEAVHHGRGARSTFA